MSEFVVIGDTHGCFETFKALLKKLPDCEKVLLGDLVDRGPRSKEMIDFMIENKDEFSSVLGNHEYFMICALEKPIQFYKSLWFQNGGNKTIASYGGSIHNIERSHYLFLKDLPSYIIKDKVLLSHTTYDQRYPLEEASSRLDMYESIIWCREEPLKIMREDLIDKIDYQIIGHTPNPEPIIEEHYANIDTGCVYNRGGCNKLTALHYPSKKVYQQENID